MLPPQPLREWLELVRRPDADELKVADAWHLLEPAGILKELADALMRNEDRPLQELWDATVHPDVRLFLDYLYVESQTHRAAAPEDRVDVARLCHALCGMVSGALAVRAALTRNVDALALWLPRCAASWAGLPSSNTPLRLPAPVASPLAWLDACLLALAPQLPAVGLTRTWTTALFETVRALQTASAPSEVAPPKASNTRKIPLLIYHRGERGLLAWLHLEAIPNGAGEFYPDPRLMALVPATHSFLQAGQTAHRLARRVCPPPSGASTEAGRFDIRWRLEGELRSGSGHTVLEGGSHVAAFALALIQLLRGEGLDPTFAISATVTEEGALGPVSGIREKCLAAFGLRDEQGSPRITRVVVHPQNADEARAAAAQVGRDPDRSIFATSSLAAFLPEASGLPEQLRKLLEGEVLSVLRDAGGRLKTEFTTFAGLQEHCVPVRVSRGTRAATWQADVPNAGQQTRVQMPWEQVRRELAGSLRRAVLLGAPGHGKTYLLWQEVGLRCAEARAKIARQADAARSVGFAVFLRAAELAEALTEETGEANPAPGAIASLLIARHQLRDSIYVPLCRAIGNGACLICLDALDEVALDVRPRLEAAIATLIQATPQAALLLTSRREGYTPEVYSIPPEGEMETLPFDDSQMRRAIRLAFREIPQVGETLWNNLQSARNLRYVLRSPLLLRIACKVAADTWQATHTVPGWNRRVELYHAFLRDLAADWARRAPIPSLSQRELFLPFASDVALELLRRGLEEESGIAAAVNAVQQRYPAMASRSPLDDLCAAGILMSLETGRHGARFLFSHRTFGEFLAAWSLARAAKEKGWAAIAAEVDALASLAEHQEVILFLAGLLHDPLPLLQVLSDASRDDVLRHRLALAALCLPEIDTAWSRP